MFVRNSQQPRPMSLLNRVALTITRKPPYVDWANGTDGPVPIVTYPENNRRTIYLVPPDDRDPDLAALLDEFWEDIFEAELNAWMQDESKWPQPRSRQVFDQWFDAEIVDAVVDLAPEEPLTEGEVEDAGIQYALDHCAWCDLELEPEQRRMVGLPLPDRQLWSGREGLTLPLPSTDRVVIGIMTTPDSPAAIEGHDVMFSACSSRCDKILRKEVPRALKRLKKLIRVP